jgi:hypothetical protein
MLEILLPSYLSEIWSPETVGGTLYLLNGFALLVLLCARRWPHLLLSLCHSCLPLTGLLSGFLAIATLSAPSPPTSLLLILSLLLCGCCYPFATIALVARSAKRDSGVAQARSHGLLPPFGIFEAVGLVARMSVPWMVQRSTSSRSLVAVLSFVLVVMSARLASGDRRGAK